MEKNTTSVIGLGFVGLSLAVTNAKNGFKTIGMDIDHEKINQLKQSKPNFYEPKLNNMLKSVLKSNSLKLTSNIEEAVSNSNTTFLTVGTPSNNFGKIELKYIKNALHQILKVLKTKKKYHLLVIKSTLPPQTTKKIILPMFQNLIKKKKIDIIVNPEFLREGFAIKDILEPHLIVIGSYNKKSKEILTNYYKKFYRKTPEIIHTDLSSAELIKYANNAFLATKISFINSIANICQTIPKSDVNSIAYAIGKDPRIGSLFLKAGPGFGGSCLPKDLAGLIQYSKDQNVNKLFRAVQEVNEIQPSKIIELMKKMKVYSKGKTISILGLSFKKDTDDIRDAVSIKIVKLLLKVGIKVRVNDPMAVDNFRKIFKEKITYTNSIADCLKNSNCCVILTEWDNYRKLNSNFLKKYMKTVKIIDSRRILNPQNFLDVDFKAIGYGE